MTDFETRSDPGDPENAPDLGAAVAAVAELRRAVDAHRGTLDDRLTRDLKGLTDRLDALELKARRPGQPGETVTPEAAELRKAFRSYLKAGTGGPAEELKGLTVANDPQGGYLAPPEFANEVIRDIVQFSPVRALATVRLTASPSVRYPRRTAITNAKWEGETEDHEESAPTFGQVDIPARNLATYVDISNQLLADSGGAAEAEVRLALAEDFGKKEGTAFIAGTGPLQPEGLMTASGVGYTATGNASTLGSAPADLLITHMYALPAAYRNRGTWLMNASTLAAIRKLKDSQGQFLWQPSLAAGQPETILGRPVIEAPDMEDVGSGTQPIIFGDIASAYRIVDRLDMSVLVNPYLLATKGMTRIHATRRVGAAVVLPSALRRIKCATS